MIDVIVPVYEGLEETVRCIQSVLDSRNTSPFNLLVVDDCSPNPAIKNYLLELSRLQKIELLVNKANLGFVSTVNRGMSLHVDRDVLLLNSDTQVANNWLDRILHHAASDSSIATITPFSNNAEICSFPRYCQPNGLFDDKSVAEVDAVFSSMPAQQIDVPTGVGFCMFIRRSALDDIGLFDEKTFGRGYGEENDFCRRGAARGWRNVTCSNVFVFHDGGVSFSTEKAARVQHAMAVLDKKYPDYHRLVHEHIQHDPECPFRVLAQLRFLQLSARRKYLFITHRLGGGVLKHLQELAGHLASDVDFIFLRPGNNGGVEIGSDFGDYHWSLHFDMTTDRQHLLDLMHALAIERLHVHHVMGVGDDVMSVMRELAVPYDVTLHDYYFINANPTLTNSDGVFAEDVATRDVMCAQPYTIPGGLSATRWREKYGLLLYGASRIFSPSARCRDIYHQYFPDLHIDVACHPEWEQSQPYVIPAVPVISGKERMKVLVIGALSREKGADVLERTATYADPLNRLEYHLLGYAYRPLAPQVVQHGAYLDADLDRLIHELQPHLVWFPAQWHETYCYTLSAALRSGLPILASDLGSFPERLLGRPLSFIKSWRSTPIEWHDSLLQIRDWLLANQGYNIKASDWLQLQSGDCGFLYRDQYVVTTPAKRVTSNPLPSIEQLQLWCYPRHAGIGGGISLSTRERVLFLLLRLREKPGIRHVLRWVPFQWQRNIKRWFSHRPVHDIVNEQR